MSRIAAIVYTSATGFTARYAWLLADETGLPAFRLEEADALAPGASVLCLGWLRAGSVRGLKTARRRFRVAGVCAVGMSPEADTEQLRRNSGLGDAPFFYLRGGYAPDKVRGLDRVLMAAMKRHLAGKSDPQSRAALAAMRQGADWVSGDQLAPVLAWLAGRGGD